MSWDVTLIDDRGHVELEQNYTHNVNGMIAAALRASGVSLDVQPDTKAAALRQRRIDDGAKCGRVGPDHQPGSGLDGLVWTECSMTCCPLSWYEVLDGCSGPMGAELLDAAIRELEAHPALYRAMDPPNGWGSYDRLLPVLRGMRDAVPEWPTVWEASG